ncbi:MAG: glycoside hydrolase, partial [Alistipes sp.]|nr:glycoside hydrolase [Candidatus Minthomonas equi]
FVLQSSKRKPVDIKWKASGNASVSIDGETVTCGLSGLTTVPAGRHTLRIEVVSGERCPALMASGTVQSAWTVSTSPIGKFLPVETDDVYSSENTYPDDRREITETQNTGTIYPITNASQSDGIITMDECGLTVIDFTELELAALSFTASGRGEISVTYGESFEEAVSIRPASSEQIPIAPIPLTDEDKTIVTPERGFRFAAIRSTGKCKIRELRMLAKMWPVKQMFRFDCSDTDFNRMFEAGVATLHTALHNFYLDGIKRDYLPWAMDATISSIGGNYLFGERQVCRNSISIALLPSKPKKEDIGIVDYPLHALIGLWEEYLRFGELATSLLYRDRIESQLALYESLQDEYGFISSRNEEWGFIPGWNTQNGPEKTGTPAYAQMMLYYNFITASRFEALWGDVKASAHYADKAAELKKNIMSCFWDDTRKAFINGYRYDGTRDDRISHHSQNMAVYTGIFPEQYTDHLYDVTYPSIEGYQDDISYEKGYEAISYARCGKTAQFVSLLKKVWLRWLETGHTRFPENFKINETLPRQYEFYNREFGLSLCHGANGVPPILTALYGILGFSVNETELSEYSFAPDLIGMEYVSGKVPVVQGYICVDFHSDGSGTVTVPAGCTVKVNFAGKQMKFTKEGKYSFK